LGKRNVLDGRRHKASMCGIAGFTFSDAAQDNRAIANNMLAAIAHRGPDARGVHVSSDLVLAHNRLSIMEPEGGQQPRVHESNGNALIYNGEIYNHRGFDQELQSLGCPMRDSCDTESLFWLLNVYGIEKTLSIVDGMFAFAWYNADKETLYLARDRFGQKPLFYSNVDGQIVFASEIKAVRCHPSLRTLRPDIEALRLYLMMEYVPDQLTGLQGIREVPPGHFLRWSNGEIEVKAYWRASDVARSTGIDSASAVDSLDHLVDTAVQQQMIADVPVGIFLSGGLDSSLIAAMARQHSNDVATFTVKFPYASFDESEHAADVARSIGTHHTMVELNRQNCIDGIELLLSRTDQPFCDSSQLPSFLLCQATKPHVTVALGGDGADELFFGYPNFKLLRFAQLMASLPHSAGGLLRGVASLLPNSTAYMNNSFLLRQLSYGIGQPAHEQSAYWMSAVPAAAQRLLWRDGIGPSLKLRRDDEIPLLEQCQRHFLESYLSGDILQKMDRASMNVSLEVRSPFLSAAVSEFALSLPVAESFRGITGKRILRSVAARYLSDNVINRKKHGFALPISELLRGDLRELAQATLLDSSNAMYEHIDYETVNSLWTMHAGGKNDNGKSLWALVMLAAFFRNQF